MALKGCVRGVRAVDEMGLAERAGTFPARRPEPDHAMRATKAGQIPIRSVCLKPDGSCPVASFPKQRVG